jgi:hypothetical protein
MASEQIQPRPQGSGDIDVHAATDWRAGLWAGLIAGIVFVMLEMMLVWLVMGMSPWAPPRMMAAMLMGRSVLPPPADFALLPVIGAMLIHIPLSIAYGLAIGWIVHRMDIAMAMAAGAVFGLIGIYFVNFYLIAPPLFPWFADARNGISIFAHAAFGAVAAAAYVGLRRPQT